MYDSVNYIELMLSSFIVGVNLKGFQKLVSGTLIVSIVSKNESPNNPVVRVFGSMSKLLNSFFDFLYCSTHFAPFKQGESPVSVAGSKIS